MIRNSGAAPTIAVTDDFAASMSADGVRTRSWLTGLALVGVFLVFVAVSAVVGLAVGPNPIALLLSNIVVLGGGALLVGMWRGLFTPRSLGLAPVRVDMSWAVIGIGLSAILLPVRAVVAAGAQLLIDGNLDSVMARGDILSGGAAFHAPTAVAMIVLAGVLVPLAEELVFRAGLFAWLRTRFGFAASAAVSSLAFSLAHFDSVGVMVGTLILGAVAAWVYARSKNFWAPLAVHMTTNVIAMVLLQGALLFKSLS